ncbi:DMT family transporter [uncultured Propionivibrio sp.]|uniref:DMT family transporter n=1 Tax=uncultured Propionivibrio sp. TaxID=426737 RepID=UPI0029C0373D|nr:DMT family transporter [uncultured Propionivibrio sp.]
MSLSALALVLFGALCHATWNIVAKKSGGGLPFVWLFGMVSVIAAIPVATWAWQTHPQQFDTLMWAAALGSGLIHVLYSLILQQGYRVADFAVVYPVARGSGPMLTVMLSVVLLGERPSLLGAASIGAILAGVFISAGGTGLFSGNLSSRRHLGVWWGLLTGLFIAAYTLLDGWAIRSLGMAPILFYAVGLAFRSFLLAPFALRQPARLAEQWALHRRAILIVGILSPLAYLLVLFALQLAPLSYVAPVREISMLLGTFVGARRLQEALKPSQYVGAIVMLLGVLGLGYA